MISTSQVPTNEDDVGDDDVTSATAKAKKKKACSSTSATPVTHRRTNRFRRDQLYPQTSNEDGGRFVDDDDDDDDHCTLYRRPRRRGSPYAASAAVAAKYVDFGGGESQRLRRIGTSTDSPNVAADGSDNDATPTNSGDADADGGLIFSGIVRAELTNEECGGSGGINTPNVEVLSDEGGGGGGGRRESGGSAKSRKSGKSSFLSMNKSSVSFDADGAALKRYTFAKNGKMKKSVETSGSSAFSTQVLTVNGL